MKLHHQPARAFNKAKPFRTLVSGSGIERRLMLSVGQRPALVVVVVLVSYTLIETLLMKLFLPGFGLAVGWALIVSEQKRCQPLDKTRRMRKH